MNKEINLESIWQLEKYKKIVVTGPHRSGTTISAKIIANILKYKFVNEFEYDGNDPMKFMGLFMNDIPMVIQNTSFLRDMHLLGLDSVVLVKRKKRDILKSYESSLRFGNESKGNIFASINNKAKNVILNHFGYKSGCIPDILYKHFEENNKNYYTVNYSDLRGHALFVGRDRRKEFKHIKQTEVSWNNL